MKIVKKVFLTIGTLLGIIIEERKGRRMDTEKTGAALHGEDATARKSAASLMGQARTEKKIAAARVNVERATEARRGVPMSEAHKAKLRDAYAARRQREQEERAALGLDTVIVAEPKRPRGRPKKQAGQNTKNGLETPRSAAGGQETT